MNIRVIRGKEEAPYARYRIVAPADVIDICVATGGDDTYREPPLDGWFVVGEDDNSEHVAIDLNEDGYGRCYDVFHETFSDPHGARVIAPSFTEFVERLFARGCASTCCTWCRTSTPAGAATTSPAAHCSSSTG